MCSGRSLLEHLSWPNSSFPPSLPWAATPPPARGLQSVQWQRVILDEAHQDDGAVKLVSELPAATKWLMTGTPLGSKLSDVSEMMAMLGLPRMRLLGMSAHLLGWALGHTAIRWGLRVWGHGGQGRCGHCLHCAARQDPS